MNTVRVVPFDETFDRPQVAHLISQATPEFFYLLGDDSERLIAPIIGEPKTDLEHVRVATDGAVLGVQVAFVASELLGRQLTTMRVLSTQVDKARWRQFRRKASRFGRSIPSVPRDAYYLSRITVAVEHRAKGVGRALLADVCEAASGRPIALHVHRDNTGARAFYAREGFREVDSDLPFLLLLGAAS